MGADGPSGFDRVSAMDSKSLLKPHVPLLVVTRSDEHGTNVMTAAWWMLAGYEPFRYLLSVDQKTHTYDVLEANPAFVMGVPTASMVEAVALCGSVSGRDVDKVARLDLSLAPSVEVDVPLLADALGNVECRVEDAFEFGNNTYYVAEVAAAHVRTGMLDGRLLRPEADPLAYMGSDWDDAGEEKYRYALSYDDELSAFPDSAVLDPDERSQ